MRIQTQKSAKKILIPVLVGFILLAGGWTAYAYTQNLWPFGSSDTTNQSNDTSDSDNSINYDPPTQQEIDSSQDAKQRGEDTNDASSDDDSSNNSGQKKSVDVGISYADIYGDNLEVRAFTNGVIEGTGTCTATVTMKDMPSMKVTQQSKAFIDASTTQCEPIKIPKSKFMSGTWTVVVSFSSPDRQGTSAAMEVTIP